MRLIDADAPQEHFTDMQHYERCACNFTDDGGEPATEWYCVEDALENAPTIDAIPVEWLREFDMYYTGIICGTPYMNELVEAWQKEQEANNAVN